MFLLKQHVNIRIGNGKVYYIICGIEVGKEKVYGVADRLGDHVHVIGFHGELVAMKLACNWLQERRYTIQEDCDPQVAPMDPELEYADQLLAVSTAKRLIY
jgi:hypothetical protein